MEAPIIPETGIDYVVLEKIKKYTGQLFEHVMRYGNSMPNSSKEDYVWSIAKEFQEWYNEYPQVRSLECVEYALDFTRNIPCISEE